MSPYWVYYEKTSPRKVENGLKAKSKRGSIGETWWSKRWVSILESFNLGARLTRGRSYARKGQVISINIDPGIVRAKVQGSSSKPYDVMIKLKPLSEDEWDGATAAMSSKAVFAARLLSGEMPQNIEEAFSDSGTSLFPKKKGDLMTACSCPDWSNPCKHIAAVYYLLAEQFDLDPFLIFKLRGRTKEQIVEALRGMRVASALEEPDEIMGPGFGSLDAAKPLEECLDSFWQKGEKIDSLEIDLKGPKVENAVLKRLGESPFFIGDLNLTTPLRRVYETAGHVARERASGGAGSDGQEEIKQSGPE